MSDNFKEWGKWYFLKLLDSCFERHFKSFSEVFLRNIMFVLGSFQVVLFFTVCFKGITRCSKKVLVVFQGNFKGVSRVFQLGFNDCQGSCMQLPRVFQNSKVFQENVQSGGGVSKGLHVSCFKLFQVGKVIIKLTQSSLAGDGLSLAI